MSVSCSYCLVHFAFYHNHPLTYKFPPLDCNVLKGTHHMLFMFTFTSSILYMVEGAQSFSQLKIYCKVILWHILIQLSKRTRYHSSLGKNKKQNSKAALFIKAWGRDIRGAIHYCPVLERSHLQKTWGQILKTFFNKFLNKRSWLLCI